MKLRVCHVIFLAYVLHIYAQEEVPPPLPSPNLELVNNFRLALEAVFGVGIRLQAFLQDEHNENFLVSPISAAVIIGELILGAEGEFRKQLVELLALPNSQRYENDVHSYTNKKRNVTYYLPYSMLHLQLSSLLKALESGTDPSKHFILTEKSAMFLDNKVKLNDSFRWGLRNLYEARVYQMNFAGNPVGTQRHINDWVSTTTNGLIPTILAAPPSPSTDSILVNAIYFKADWKMPFSDMLSRPGVFNVSATKSVPVTYMINQMDQILYAESPDYRVIGLPYTNEELGMYIILPRPNNRFKYDMKQFADNLKSREILETIGKGKRRDVVVKIPKMDLSYSFSLLNQLKKYQVFKKQSFKVNATNIVDKLETRVDVFKNFTTDVSRDILLTAAAVGQDLRVDDIVQQVVISINEKGTEAAAVSAATIDYMGGAKNFIVERPFVFFIRHEATAATLFWGIVSNPAA